MSGCDVVFYCVVDARAWLKDPSPLFRTNVEGLRHVLDAAVDAELDRFVFMSTIATLAVSADGTPVTEDDPINWYDDGGAYTQCRVDAENLVLRYAKEQGLPAVALCISNTYGPRDWQPTPHGGLIAIDLGGQGPLLLRGSRPGSRRYRGRGGGDDPGHGPWTGGGALHHLRPVRQHP